MYSLTPGTSVNTSATVDKVNRLQVQVESPLQVQRADSRASESGAAGGGFSYASPCYRERYPSGGHRFPSPLADCRHRAECKRTPRRSCGLRPLHHPHHRPGKRAQWELYAALARCAAAACRLAASDAWPAPGCPSYRCCCLSSLTSRLWMQSQPPPPQAHAPLGADARSACTHLPLSKNHHFHASNKQPPAIFFRVCHSAMLYINRF